MSIVEILQKISGHDDLKALNDQQLSQLCGEIRQFLISSVSKTGGHLAGNLGAVSSVSPLRPFSIQKKTAWFLMWVISLMSISC